MKQLFVKAVGVACSTILLASCASPVEVSPSPSASPTSSAMQTRTVPESCELTEMVAAFDQRIEGAEFIPTDWEPGQETDLFDVYEAGGIACTYGIQSAEIGGTVMWALADDELWTTKISEWKATGYTETDIPNLEEHQALVLETTGADGSSVWYINFHIDGVWIQFGASKFIASLDDALGIIQAAAAVTK